MRSSGPLRGPVLRKVSICQNETERKPTQARARRRRCASPCCERTASERCTMLAYAQLKSKGYLLHAGQALLRACVLAAAVLHRARVERAYMAPELNVVSAYAEYMSRSKQTVSDWSQTWPHMVPVPGVTSTMHLSKVNICCVETEKQLTLLR
jgi:hypothetical protein